VLRDFYAFELMMAPYAIGHLRMGTLLTELGYTMSTDDRFKLYLTNTLEDTVVQPGQFGSMSGLAEESLAAGVVKRRQPVLAIMGNPPYSGTSSNKGAWISALINDYKQVDGKPLGEKNPKWLQDDYVKFIRFAQWKIDQAGEGVLGFITNHGYLDNPTFRGMRQSLMKSFSQLHILNLHGNPSKEGKCPDGSKDENVFDIEVGVSIILAVKRNDIAKGVWYSDLWGSRVAKYAALGNGQMTKTTWQKLEPRGDMYFFVPQDATLAAEYEQWSKVTDIFPVSSVGIVTARDDLTIKFTPEQVWQTVNRLISMPPEEAREAFHLGKDSQEWKVQLAQDDIRGSGPSRDRVVPILYRPFDIRYTYYTGHSGGFLCRPRPEVMQNMLQQNIALVTSRMTKGEDFHHAQVVQNITEVICMSPKTSNNGFVFPLYLYEKEQSDSAFQKANSVKRPNIASEILVELASLYGATVTPEQVFDYVYAILNAPAYRSRYVQFLKSDFPRIPFTKDRDTFLKLADLGQQLIDLHLMRSPELDNPISRFCGKGDGVVAKIEYDADHGRVSINPTQYFDGVTPDLWCYQVGGYLVLSKWLKDRKSRFLTSADTIHYSRIVTALMRTEVLQTEIDGMVERMDWVSMSITRAAEGLK